MFAILRRYQRALYFVITGVIVFSFSFFGTYSAFMSSQGEDPIVFVTIDGKRVYRSDLSDMVRFFSSDSLLLVERGESLSNPLNDGVIANDIVATGIGDLLVERFSEDLKTEYILKLRREKAFSPYVHPQASFIGAQQAWNYFAPRINESLENLKTLQSGDVCEIYKAKKRVFLAEREFPSVLLRQVLGYQQKQFAWIEPDISLPSRSLCLFNYQQMGDWFGHFFIDKSCEFIMQTAAYARKQGMSVSSDEVMASLYQNARDALKRLPVGIQLSPEDLIKRTMQELGMDKARIVHVWGDVLLFRKALIDLPRDIIVNAEPFRNFMRRKFQGRELDLYQLQAPLRFVSQQDLYEFQFYLNSVAQMENDVLVLPKEFKSVEKVRAIFPQFVERECIFRCTQTSVEDLGKRVRVKDIWEWQSTPENFEILEKEMPLLSEMKSLSPEERIENIGRLPKQLRDKAEQMAVEAIVKEHSHWIAEALQKNEPKTHCVGIRLQGGKLPFTGIDDGKAFIDVLSKAEIGEQDPSLLSYTQNGKNFFRIVVLDIAKEDSLVPFSVVKEDGTLAVLLDLALEAAYPKIRGTKPSAFKNAKEEWKKFSEVRETISESYFATLLKQLDLKIEEYRRSYPKYCNFDDLKSARVAIRFLPHLLIIADRLKNGEDSRQLIGTPYERGGDEAQVAMLQLRPLTDLWLLVESKKLFTRDALARNPQFQEAFDLVVGAYVTPKYSKEMGPFFAKIARCYEENYEEDLRSMIYRTTRELGNEAIVQKTRQLFIQFFPQGVKK